jgi:hypothetical protein
MRALGQYAAWAVTEANLQVEPIDTARPSNLIEILPHITLISSVYTEFLPNLRQQYQSYEQERLSEPHLSKLSRPLANPRSIED